MSVFILLRIVNFSSSGSTYHHPITFPPPHWLVAAQPLCARKLSLNSSGCSYFVNIRLPVRHWVNLLSIDFTSLMILLGLVVWFVSFGDIPVTIIIASWSLNEVVRNLSCVWLSSHWVGGWETGRFVGHVDFTVSYFHHLLRHLASYLVHGSFELFNTGCWHPSPNWPLIAFVEPFSELTIQISRASY